MRRKNMILLSVMIAGLLLCGIGGGILVNEFSELSYGEAVVLGADTAKLTTETQCFEISLDTKNKTYLQTGFNWYDTADIIEDESLPVGQVCYQLTYDSDLVKVEPRYCSDTEGGQNPYIYVSYRDINQVREFMMLKDKILEDLKNKKISSYHVTHLQDMKILMHPDTKKYICIAEGY